MLILCPVHLLTFTPSYTTLDSYWFSLRYAVNIIDVWKNSVLEEHHKLEVFHKLTFTRVLDPAALTVFIKMRGKLLIIWKINVLEEHRDVHFF